MPRAHALAYAAALLVAVSLAVAGWFGGAEPTTVAAHPSTLPSEQFEPASFRPAPPPAPDDGAPSGFR